MSLDCCNSTIPNAIVMESEVVRAATGLVGRDCVNGVRSNLFNEDAYTPSHQRARQVDIPIYLASYTPFSLCS